MSEQWHCENLPSDHLWGIVEHAQSQIDMWLRRQRMALGQLAVRGEIGESYPDELNGQL